MSIMELLPACVAWVKLPCPGDDELNLPDGSTIHWWKEISSSTDIFILVEHDDLQMIYAPDAIPLMRVAWTQQPPIYEWRRAQWD